MFSDIGSPTTSFGLNRSFATRNRADSPKSFHYPSVVGPPTLALPLEPPSHQERNPKPNNTTLAVVPSINTKTTEFESLRGSYYFDHPTPIVPILVQGCLFKVHRYFLERDSLFLRGALSTAQAQSQPIELQGVSTREFESLLNFFYDGMYRNDPNAVSITEWIDLLTAASALKFDRVREHAIAAIDNAYSERPDAIEMMVLAEKHGITKWLRPAYISVCQRREPLQLNEAERIGLDKVVKLTQAREEFLRESLIARELRAVSPLPSPYPWPPRAQDSTRCTSTPTPAINEAGRTVDRIFFISGTID